MDEDTLMTGEELREMRGDRSAQEFGCHVADVMGKERPYTAQEVWNWENGLRPVPRRVAIALISYERRHWLIVPHGLEFLLRTACPICGARNPVMHETARPPRTLTIEFSCGAAERLSGDPKRRTVIGKCGNRSKVLGLPAEA
jgi:hypothetical protein